MSTHTEINQDCYKIIPQNNRQQLEDLALAAAKDEGYDLSSYVKLPLFRTLSLDASGVGLGLLHKLLATS